MSRPRVAILRNPDKPAAEATLADLTACLAARAEVVATGCVGDPEISRRAGLDRVVVLGGDGSIQAVARSMGDRQVPIVGVNFGKLGYLAEFSVEDLGRQLDAVLTDARAVSRRMMLDASIRRDGAELRRTVAVNDCVVHAGPPYRMIELAILVDGVLLTSACCDGLVISTPSGSTAHNLSIGGPILQSEISAMVVSPISPHALTHRPLVVAGESRIEVQVRHVNEGTTLVIDGQVTVPLAIGDRVAVERCPHEFQLVRNPAQSRWHTLIEKLKWGK
jgi:NAD+ kinase